MGHLVADHTADGAVVDRRIRVRIEERRLQDRRREDHLVVQRVVVGVDLLRDHAPLGLVGGLARPRRLPRPFKGLGPGHVAEIVPVADVQPAVVPELVRIADLDDIAVQLLQRLGLGLGAHPVQLLDARPEGGLQIGHQGLHLGLGLRREIAGHIDLAQGLAHGAVDRPHHPLPAHGVLRLAVDRLAEEGEARIDEVLRQIGRRIAGRVEGLPGLQRAHRRAGVDRRQLRKSRLLGHNHVLDPAQIGGGQQHRPVDPRREGLQLGGGEGIVDLVRIALVLPGPVDLGNLGLEQDDGVGRRRGLRPAAQAQEPRHIGLVGLLLLGEFGLQIIVAVGHAEAALAEFGDVVIRVLVVGLDADVGDRGVEGLGRLTHQDCHLAVRPDRADGGQGRGQRLGAQGVDGPLVQARAVEGAQLSLHRVHGAGLGPGVVEDGLHPLLRQVLEDPEGAIAGLVRRNGGVGEPGSVGVFEEVVPRLDLRVLPGPVKAPGPHVGGARLVRARGPGRQYKPADHSQQNRTLHKLLQDATFSLTSFPGQISLNFC